MNRPRKIIKKTRANKFNKTNKSR